MAFEIGGRRIRKQMEHCEPRNQRVRVVGPREADGEIKRVTIEITIVAHAKQADPVSG